MSSVASATRSGASRTIGTLDARHATVVVRPGIQQLAFRLASEEYAFDILQVQEIRGYARPTRLPDMAPCFQGVIDLRGSIVPVMDLRTRLGLGSATNGDTAVTIVLDLGSQVLGVVVDAVSDVVDVPPQAFRQAPRLGAGEGDTIVGMAQLRDADRDRLLILLDAARLMSDAGGKSIELN